ncbi:MAG: hypothetical protein ABI885_17080 [Gammaproteobacteria bacterium]
MSVTPIEAGHLDEVGRFLNTHLNSRISAANWIGSLRHEWSAARPNYGMQLRDADKLVGVMLAVYSDQNINGTTERFCNPHSWCVLPDYRNHGIGLVLHLIKQTGFHLTMLTPNPKVAQIFRGLRFKDLDDRLLVFPNLPSPAALLPGRFVETDLDRIAARLAEAGADSVRQDLEQHRQISWLRFMAFGSGRDVCLIVYKPSTWKRLPSARIIHVSDAAALERYRGLMQYGLLAKQGFVTSRVEARFLSRTPPLAYRTKRTQAKLFQSRSLKDSQIRDLYSELVALDV